MSRLLVKNIAYGTLEEKYRSAAIQLMARCNPEVDRGHIRSLVNSVFLTRGTAKILYSAVTPEEKLVGVCLTQHMPNVLDCHFGFGSLAVDERYRKQRIGTKLTRFALSYLRKSVSRYGTVLLCQGGDSSEAFYQRLGFQTVYRDPLDRPVMARSISSRQPLNFPK